MIQIAKVLLLLDEEVKEREADLKELKRERDRVNGQLMTMMADEEVQNFSLMGKVLYLNTRTSASPVGGGREKLYQALQTHGYADIVKPTINANTLSATVREIMEQNGGDLPLWLCDHVNLYTETKVNIKKGGTYHV